MKILFITTSFNGMAQRAWVELDHLNHQVKVHIASTQQNMMDAVNEFQPDLIIAPYLKAKIPEIIWKNFTCLIVHPGIVGDRGASSLDWAILSGEKEWGVTILEAAEKMDTGKIWSAATFPMRSVSKSFLYRHEVTNTTMQALLEAIKKFEEKSFISQSVDEIEDNRKGKWNRSTNENDFSFLWSEETSVIIKKINAADSFPGAVCRINNKEYLAYGVIEEEKLKGNSGEILAKRNNAVCVATKDGAIWIQCLKKKDADAIKLPAAIVLNDELNDIEESTINIFDDDDRTMKTFREIWYEEANDVGYIHFNLYNGAMSSEQCKKLQDVFIKTKQRNTKVIVLMGGEDIWNNGIHLNLIEASENPAQTSWENINAIDDLIHEIICTDTHYIISALQGNAGAGGVSLALAADKVLARKGIVVNPHTRNMGLYGSEYWTYLLPKRIGTQRANMFTEQCLPWGTDIAMEVKLIDDVIDGNANFYNQIKKIAEDVTHLSYYNQLITAKKFKRKRDESYKPLEKYRAEELEKMYANFFDDDWSYDYKRYCFVHKINPGENINNIADKDLFSERRKIWRRRKYEKLFYEA